MNQTRYLLLLTDYAVFGYDFTKKDARQTYLSVYLRRRTVQNAVGYRQYMFASTRKIFVKFQPKYNICNHITP